KEKLIEGLIANPELAEDIKISIEKVKHEISEAKKDALEAQDFEKDFIEFIGFAFDFLDNLPNKWWSLDKQTMKICKQIVFPSGIQLLPNKKVYIPEISPIYRGSQYKTAS